MIHIKLAQDFGSTPQRPQENIDQEDWHNKINIPAPRGMFNAYIVDDFLSQIYEYIDDIKIFTTRGPVPEKDKILSAIDSIDRLFDKFNSSNRT